MGNAGSPGNQFALPENGNKFLHVRIVDIAQLGVVIDKNITVFNARITFVIGSNDVFERLGHGVNVRHDPRGQGDRVTFRGIQPEAQLADFTDNGRRRNVERGLAGSDKTTPQARPDLFIADRVLLLNGKIFNTPIMTSFGEQALTFRNHFD